MAAAVTIIQPEGEIWGVSTDYPYIKVFNPVQHISQANSKK